MSMSDHESYITVYSGNAGNTVKAFIFALSILTLNPICKILTKTGVQSETYFSFKLNPLMQQ